MESNADPGNEIDGFKTNMADDGRKLRGRFKEYMRHHNPYKFKPARLAARRRSGRINLLKADKNPCPTICQSGSNDQVL